MKAKEETESYLSQGLSAAEAEGKTANEKACEEARTGAAGMTEEASAKEAEVIRAIIDEIVN